MATTTLVGEWVGRRLPVVGRGEGEVVAYCYHTHVNGACKVAVVRLDGGQVIAAQPSTDAAGNACLLAEPTDAACYWVPEQSMLDQIAAGVATARPQHRGSIARLERLPLDAAVSLVLVAA